MSTFDHHPHENNGNGHNGNSRDDEIDSGRTKDLV